jgi:hypothetical protein
MFIVHYTEMLQKQNDCKFSGYWKCTEKHYDSFCLDVCVYEFVKLSCGVMIDWSTNLSSTSIAVMLQL